MFEYNCFLLFVFCRSSSHDIAISFHIPLTNVFCITIWSHMVASTICNAFLFFKPHAVSRTCSCLNGSPCVVLGSWEVLAASTQSHRQSYTYYQDETKTFCSILYIVLTTCPTHNFCIALSTICYSFGYTIQYNKIHVVCIHISISCPTFDALAFILGYHSSLL